MANSLWKKSTARSAQKPKSKTVAYPVVPVKLCDHLKDAVPGKLAADKLRKTVGGTLHHCAADAWEAMVDAAQKAGIKLTPTSAGDTYRTLESQTKAFFQRYQLESTGNPDTRKFEGKVWYLKKGQACLATPGKSQHNLGIAVDVATASGPRLKWMLDNEHLFGFSHEVQSEPWHIRYTQGNQVPPAVAAFVAAKAG